MAPKSALYTKAGDRGETTLFGGKKVKKSAQRVASYGSLDELNSALGVASSFQQDKKIGQIIESIQNELFNLGAEIANPSKGEFNASEEKITQLEAWIDQFDAKLPKLANFILPGGSKASAFLHQSRTVCRRAEREVVRLAEKEAVNPNIVKYINRLSDLLFVLARTSNNGKDILWKK